MHGIMMVVCFTLACFPALYVRAAELVKDGQPTAIVIVDRKAKACEWRAADELIKHIEAISGARLPIMKLDLASPPDVSSLTRNGHTIVVIGRNRLNQTLHDEIDALDADAYLIDVMDNVVMIAGNDGSFYNDDALKAPASAGTLYGVYHVLEQLGVRWYWPHETLGTVIPKLSTIALDQQHVTNAPAFPMRLTEGMVDPWFRRIGYGGDRDPWASRHSFRDWGKRFADSHPEYFILDNNGQRNVEHIGFPHHGVIEQMTQDARNFYESSLPDSKKRYFLVLANDYFMTMCTCGTCQAQVTNDREEAGLFSDYIGNGVVQVAKHLADEYPDKLIVYGAYERYLLPPTHIDVLPDNIAVMLASKRRSRPVMGTLTPEKELLKQWQAKKPREIYIWRYYTFGNKGFPYLMPHLIADSVREMHHASTTGKSPILGEMHFRRGDPNTIWWFALDDYVTSKMLWNPDADVDAILDEYYQLFFGPAAEPMAQFHQILEELYLTHSEMSLIPEPKARQLGELLQKALRKATQTPYRDRLTFINEHFRALTKIITKYDEQARSSAFYPPSDEDLILHYTFDQHSNIQIEDQSGHGHTAHAIDTTLADGISNTSLSFNGQSSCILLDQPVNLKGNYTLSAWIKPDAVTSQEILYGENLISYQPYTIYGSYAYNPRWDQVSLSLANAKLTLHDTNVGTVFSIPLEVKAGKWYHVVSTVDHVNSEICLYMDGRPVGIETVLNTDSGNTTPLVYIGASGELTSQASSEISGVRRIFGGCIDEARVYRRALSASEVLGLFQATSNIREGE
ncbi:MAG: DUF4838 domain-containing protein [Phycisphaeraceae bacterium]|nr:DUF4838 domain-containing protein [Phycisphaeraceae bacterium]